MARNMLHSYEGGTVYRSPINFSSTAIGKELLKLTGLPFTPSSESFLYVEERNLFASDIGVRRMFTSTKYAFTFNEQTSVLRVEGASFNSGNMYSYSVGFVAGRNKNYLMKMPGGFEIETEATGANKEFAGRRIVVDENEPVEPGAKPPDEKT